MATRWAVHDAGDIQRRIMFGSAERAESFARENPGWVAYDDDDEQRRPLAGEPGREGRDGWPVPPVRL